MSSVISPAWTPDPYRHSGRLNDKPEQNDTVTINSPLLFQMLNKLSAENKHCVLDMGRANQGSIEYFSDYWCTLFIADAVSRLCLPVDQDADSDEVWNKVLEASMPFHQKNMASLDMIFLWSLPNYLNPQQLKYLIEYLMPHTSERVKLHTYIFNTQMMPAMPANYKITQDKKVAVLPLSTEQKKCPLYHLADLNHCLSPFKVDHSVMLSSGIQEYIFSI